MAKKTIRKVVSKKTTPAKTPTPEPVQESSPVETTTPVVQVETWETSFDRVVALQKALSSTMKELNTEVKTLKKRFAKELKSKSSRKRTSSGKPRKPSGFAKPTAISKQLCSFLGKPEGTEMARTEVTKLLTQYVRDHNLQDPSNKRNIVPDDRLKKLLNVKASDTVTYFNLQTHMKPHFPKSASSSSA